MNQLSWSVIRAVLKIRAVWLLMIIILCAYTAYKATDLFSLYASTVMNYNAIEAAQVGTSLFYMRPVLGVVIGFLADKSKPSLWLMIGFLLTVMASFIFGTDLISDKTPVLFFTNILVIAVGVYSCRVLYFATLEEASIPLEFTGTAVGLASIIGYTPDIFSGPMFGVLVDHPNGSQGLQNAFSVLLIFGSVGLLCSYLLYRASKYHTNFPDATSRVE